MSIQELLLTGIMIVSILTGLFTQSIKNVYKKSEKEYNSELLAGIVAIFLSAIVGVFYIILAEVVVTPKIIVLIIILAFFGWLCATVGYDKVMAAFNIKNNKLK